MKFIANIYYLFIALFLIFPSSFLSSLKTVVFLLLILSLFYVISVRKILIKDVLILLASFFGLTIHIIIGITKDTILIEQGLMAFRAFITFFILLFTTYYFGKKDIINFISFLKVGFYSVLIYLVGKIFLSFYIIIGGVDVLSLKEAMPGMVIQQFYGNPYLTRIVSATDIVNAFLFVFVVIIRDLKDIFNTKLYSFYLFLSAFLMIQSYTRYIWVVLFLVLSVKLFLLSKNRINNIFYVFVLILTVSIVSLMFFSEQVNLLIELLNIKFSDTTSLSVKSVQADYLFYEFTKHPLLGKGLGSYVEYYIRDNKQLFQYETQIFAFLMQFGIVGFVIFLSPIIFIIIPYLRKNKQLLILAFFYFLWLLSGFTNPYLTVLACVSVYALFILYPIYLNKNV